MLQHSLILRQPIHRSLVGLLMAAVQQQPVVVIVPLELPIPWVDGSQCCLHPFICYFSVALLTPLRLLLLSGVHLVGLHLDLAARFPTLDQ
jgi:hypothetical protein